MYECPSNILSTYVYGTLQKYVYLFVCFLEKNDDFELILCPIRNWAWFCLK